MAKAAKGKKKVKKKVPPRPPKGTPIHPNILKNMPNEQLALKAVEWLKEGLSMAKVREMLANDEINKKRNGADVNVVLADASRRVRQEFAKEKQHILALHTQRYDRDIKKLLNINVKGYDLEMQRDLKTNAFMQALDVLYQKEKLLQIHTKGFQVRINNKINTKVKEKKVDFDLSKLTLEEKIEFLALVMKAKKTQTELLSIKLNAKKEQVVEDIDYEEVGPEVTQLQLYKPEVKEVTTIPGQTLGSVKMKLADALRKKAEEEFKRKGGKV